MDTDTLLKPHIELFAPHNTAESMSHFRNQEFDQFLVKFQKHWILHLLHPAL